jgi:hypothetical protein
VEKYGTAKGEGAKCNKIGGNLARPICSDSSLGPYVLRKEDAPLY